MAVEPLRIEPDVSGEAAGCLVVWLEQPGQSVVVLDRPLIARLEATLRQVPADARGLVLASASERVFVAGADLRTIQQSGDEDLHTYLRHTADVFGMLLDLPCPTVAAINGAALGGGLELAMHCDGLVAAPPPSGRPYPVGLPEAGLSICPGWGGTNLLPARMDPAEAIRRTASGKPLTYDEAVQSGLFDAVAPDAASLLQTARRWVLEQPAPRRDGEPLRWIGRADRAPAVLEALDRVSQEIEKTPPAEAVFDAVNTGLTAGWARAIETERTHLVRLRATPQGKRAIEAFFAKSAGR